MKIGFVQFNPAFGDKAKNCRTVKRLLAHINADVILLPELFNTGYAFLDKKELADLAEPTTGETSAFINRLAKEKGCAIAYGFAEKTADSYYNSMAFIAPSGTISTYRKSHLFFEEKYLFDKGNTGFHVFEYDSVKFGMLICWDWIYPEAMRTLALKGAQIILHAANLVTPYCPDAMITRAIENRVFIVTADRTGDEIRDGKSYHFIGMSQVVEPGGNIRMRVADETVANYVEIDPNAALHKDMNQHNDLFLDRRAELYFK
jgi:predicted amidohydrolase